jgi:sulfite reductase (NADPH) flavoprotein alpha-component
VTLANALRERVELSRLSRPLLLRYAETTGASELQALLQPDAREALQHYLRNHQLVDLLRRYTDALDAQTLLDVLPPLQQRLYSIASSPAARNDEVHLTVALRADERAGSVAFGACSTALAALAPGSRIGAWVEPNARFRLPEDDTRDVIMIGPGTGVAPFRGFLQERIARGSSGRNWLLFGSRKRYFDFLYQTEWLQALSRGQLQRLSLAFSRDTAKRVYVQDRLRAEARELYRWIDGGAHIYLCGDAFAMAPAVEAALVDVIASEAHIDAEAAAARLAQLRRDGRFALDVY